MFSSWRYLRSFSVDFLNSLEQAKLSATALESGASETSTPIPGSHTSAQKQEGPGNHVEHKFQLRPFLSMVANEKNVKIARAQ
jgi:hypothetical protein